MLLFWLAEPRRLIVPALIALLALAVAVGLNFTGNSLSRPPVYVALGASDAVGTGANRPENESWPAFVHAGLPEGTQLLNLGIGGATLREVLEQQLPPALDARPRWVTLWPGVNDLRDGVSLATFRQQLDTVLGSLANAPTQSGELDPILLVLTIPDLRLVPAFATDDPQQLNATVLRWNAVISEVGRRHGAIIVDLYEHGLDVVAYPEYISADGFHPSTAGYRRIAELVLAALSHHVSSQP